MAILEEGFVPRRPTAAGELGQMSGEVAGEQVRDQLSDGINSSAFQDLGSVRDLQLLSIGLSGHHTELSISLGVGLHEGFQCE